ncbi:hypothetical protein C7S18_04115 [Ahniella affigens]|uniref:Uncharacterized protein n=1 Tax=Ahniella affigens TaxID=2021234 RepID=A0A2P1PNL0_9GAMM|nr:hypothetical protein C7S18_04115 [Ahniella affigens]
MQSGRVSAELAAAHQWLIVCTGWRRQSDIKGRDRTQGIKNDRGALEFDLVFSNHFESALAGSACLLRI